MTWWELLLLIILLAPFLFVFSKALEEEYYNRFSNKRLFKYISWIKNEDLMYEIQNIQYQLIDKKDYQILFNDQREKENFKKIILLFKEYITKKYFSEKLCLDRKISKLTQIEFFILMLRYFLHENEFDENFLFFGKYKIDMYKIETISYKGRTHQDCIYKLTEFSTTYNKLYLIVELFCERNVNIQKIIPRIINYRYSDTIKETLDNQQVEVMIR